MKTLHVCITVAMLALFTACGQTPATVSTVPATNTSAPVPATNTPAPAPATNAPAPKPTQTLVGSWTTILTKEDLLRVVPDFKQEFLCDNAGTIVWQFKADGTFSLDQPAPIDGCPKPENTHIESTWASDGNMVMFAKGTPDQEQYEWKVEGDMLTFKYVSGNCIPCKASTTANPWKLTGS